MLNLNFFTLNYIFTGQFTSQFTSQFTIQFTMPFTMPFTVSDLRKLQEELRLELARLTALTRPPFAIVRFKIKPQKRKPMHTLAAFSASKKRMYGSVDDCC